MMAYLEEVWRSVQETIFRLNIFLTDKITNINHQISNVNNKEKSVGFKVTSVKF